MIDLIIFIYVVVTILVLILGFVNFLDGSKFGDDDAVRWGARLALAAPFWPVALLILLIIKAELFKRR